MTNPNHPHAILIGAHLYGYGESWSAAWADFRRQIAGATGRMRDSMVAAARGVRLTDDEASEVAEMLATAW